MTPDLVIRDARVVNEFGETPEPIDVAVSGAVIVGLGKGLSKGASEYEAEGRLLTPGGIDTHCHLAQVSASGVSTADDFFTGTRSAIHGGTTTAAAFVVQHRGENLRDRVNSTIERARAETVSNLALHLIVTEWIDSRPDDLRWAIDKGVTSIKVFMTYDRLRLNSDQLLEALATAVDLGMTVMIHAEHDSIISAVKRRLVAEGRSDATAHRDAHNPLAERAGVAEALALAELTGARIYLVHTSTQGSLEEIRAARRRGVSVMVETCPHYLLLDEEVLEGPITSTARFMSSPPVRGRTDRQALIDALVNREVDVVASDHAPYRVDSGKLPNGELTTFTEVANGMPGIEVRYPLMMSLASQGPLSTTDVVRLCSSNPARALGLFPKKGSLDEGADADLVLWDVGVQKTIRLADLHDANDYTPYEGLTVDTWPRAVWMDGRMIVPPIFGGLEQGSGRYLERSL